MRGQSERMVAVGAAPEPGQRLWMSKAARRAVRQRCALAAEMNLHSVSLLGSVWTLHHPNKQPRPKPESANQGMGTNAATSRRGERSAARLQEFQAAQRFRLARFFRRWKRLKQPPTSMLLPSPQSSLALPPPSSQPVATQDQVVQQPTQQHREHMAISDRSKRAVPSSPVASDSPATPRAKRVLLPDGPPPPSLPPSPPSPQGGKQPPGPSGPKQTGERQRRAGGSQAVDGEAGGSRRLEFSPSETVCACFCGATRGVRKIDGYYMCKKCKAELNSESEPESSEEEPCYTCSDSEGEGEPAPTERPNNKGYSRCQACDHWLPWLWDKKYSLCAKCSRNAAIRAFSKNHIER